MVRPTEFNLESLFLSSNFRGFQILSDNFINSQIFSSSLLSRLKPINVGSWESISFYVAQPRTTPRRNPHLGEKQTVGNSACEVYAIGWSPLFKNKNKPQSSPVRSPKEPPAVNGSPEYKLNKIHYNFMRNTNTKI